jgi:hypothetical protein
MIARRHMLREDTARAIAISAEQAQDSADRQSGGMLMRVAARPPGTVDG